MNVRTKLMKEHVNGCQALRQVAKGSWSHPWFFVGTVNRAKDGTRRGRWHVWLVFLCNDPGCSAEMLINADDVIVNAIEAKEAGDE